MNNDGGPAFPGEQVSVFIPNELKEKAEAFTVKLNGMSLRAYFAAKALQGLVASARSSMYAPIDYAKDSILIADALIAELEKK